MDSSLLGCHDWAETPVVSHTVTRTTEQLTDLKLGKPHRLYETYSSLRSTDSEALPSPVLLLGDSIFAEPEDLAADESSLFKPESSSPPSPFLGDGKQKVDRFGIDDTRDQDGALPIYSIEGDKREAASPMPKQYDGAAHQPKESLRQIAGSCAMETQEEDKTQLTDQPNKLPATPCLTATENGRSFGSTVGLDLNVSCRLSDGAESEPLTLSLTVNEEVLSPTTTTTTSRATSSSGVTDKRVMPRACRSTGSFTRRQIKMKYRISQRRGARPAENADMRQS